MSSPRPRRIQILALTGCTPIVPVGILDLLRKSDELAAAAPRRARRPPLALSLVSPRRSKTVFAAGGLELRCAESIVDAEPGDLVVVPALDPDVLVQLADNAAVVPWVARAHAAGADVASVCTGAFVLAEAGLLDGRQAATHWAFQPLFAAHYPRVRLVPEAVIVDSGRLVTTGGATSFLNLALVLVERLLGPDVARLASKMFLIDRNKAPQGAYALFGSQKQHADAAIHEAQAHIEAALADPPSIEALARQSAMSPRTFMRRFHKATGNAPREYVQRVRIEAAKRALEAGDAPVQDVARQVGYGDPVAFRKMFVRLTGLTPSDYRTRYGARTAPGHVVASGRATARRGAVRP